MKNKDVFSFFNKITKEEQDNKSRDWKNGWWAGQLGEDMDMGDKEIENMSEDWKNGLKFAITHPTGGAIPMQKLKGVIMKNLHINEVWPISTEIIPDGGIGIDWSGTIGFGQFILYWGEDGKLHADTEYLSSNENKDFIKAILDLLVEEIIVDD